jgi:hypothetical protein
MDTEVMPTASAQIPWDEIVRTLQDGMTMPDAARRYHVKYDTIKKYVQRKHIALPSRTLQGNIEQNLNRVVTAALEKVVDKWAEKGEKHREVAFDIAHESLKKFKAKAPKSFRELEAADKIARRAAGLETADAVQATLINVNEAIANFDGEVREVPRVIDIENPIEPLPAATPQIAEQ